MSNKSEATWHPDTAPEVPHADLRDRIANALQDDIYACTRVWEAWQVGTMTADEFTPAWENDDVLDNILGALGDMVPVAEHERLVDEAEAIRLKDLTEANNDRLRFEDGYQRVLAERDALQRGLVAATERAEAAEAERDALAHVIEQVREWAAIAPAWNLLSREGAKAVVRIIDHAPVSLALHDAEVKAQALEEAAEILPGGIEDGTYDWLYFRAATIRKEAK